jgi:hypothetical protein
MPSTSIRVSYQHFIEGTFSIFHFPNLVED